jgi:hypothetical protein
MKEEESIFDILIMTTRELIEEIRALRESLDSKRKKEPSKPKPRGAIKDLNLAAKLLATVSHDLQNAWMENYADKEWVLSELRRASMWIKANEKRAPKSNVGAFLNNWLTSGWEKKRKEIPSQPIPPPSDDWAKEKARHQEESKTWQKNLLGAQMPDHVKEKLSQSGLIKTIDK